MYGHLKAHDRATYVGPGHHGARATGHRGGGGPRGEVPEGGGPSGCGLPHLLRPVLRVQAPALHLLRTRRELPKGAKFIPDEMAVTLGDLCPTAWHAAELGHVGEGDTVAIWAAGPVGIVAAHCCFVRGADRVVLIDKQQYRLDRAKNKMPHLETINFAERDVEEALKEMFAASRGPDVCIECVGFHYAESWAHKAEMALGLETDTPEIINQMMRAVRKGGRLSVIGDYAGFANHFNLGALMEKGLTLASGMTSMQRYWPLLLQLIQEGKLDPSLPLTHRLPLEDAPAAYKDFNDKRRGCIKVVFFPGMSRAEGPPEPTAAES